MHISKDVLETDGAGECIFHHGCVSVSSFQKWEMMVAAVDVLGLSL